MSEKITTVVKIKNLRRFCYGKFKRRFKNMYYCMLSEIQLLKYYKLILFTLHRNF